ncbi:MAG: hypothetical protein JO362_08915 [Streptomycetaceae bacterium]|nr:hypothetical protein [Streptomycetaceae bacterium]
MSLKSAMTITAAALALAVPCAGASFATSAAPKPKVAGAATAVGQSASAKQRAYASTVIRNGVTVTLRITLDPAPSGSAPTAGKTGHDQLYVSLTSRLAAAQAQTSAPAATRNGPYLLYCNTNPTYTNAAGTLDARFNCAYSVINWGLRIAPSVQSNITGDVTEHGVWWWKNGVRMPKNSPHPEPKDYIFHGTLKPVRNGDVVQFQDYMTFPVRINGRTGTGTLTWATEVRAKD